MSELNWMIKQKSKDEIVKEKENPTGEKVEQKSITKIGILKLGNIASSVLLEMLLDERADRLDIQINTISSGAKLEDEVINKAYDLLSKLNYNLIIIITPNASLPNISKLILRAYEKKPVIVITDTMKKETIDEFSQNKIGFLIVKSDAMIGARREFLDPTEMAIYNSDLLRVLAIGGVLPLLQIEIDKVISTIANKGSIVLPQIEITPRLAVSYANFSNPYAEAKATAALEIAQKVASINNEGCFKMKEREEYIPQITTGHEMMRIASKLAEEAREIEKSNNKVRRQPHSYEGEVQDKRLLSEKPTSHYK